MTLRSTTEFLAHRERVRSFLHDKATKNNLDTSMADKVMGIGREIRILLELLENNLKQDDFRKILIELETI
jgi:hypothetical protein